MLLRQVPVRTREPQRTRGRQCYCWFRGQTVHGIPDRLCTRRSCTIVLTASVELQKHARPSPWWVGEVDCQRSIASLPHCCCSPPHYLPSPGYGPDRNPVLMKIRRNSCSCFPLQTQEDLLEPCSNLIKTGVMAWSANLKWVKHI